MPIGNSFLAVIVASNLVGTPEPSEAAEPVAPAPAAEPAPEYPASYQTPPPSGPVPLESQQTGLGMMIAGPLTVAVGIPFSFLGNLAWRDNCGPTSSNRECADGTLGSLGAHTVTAFAYTAGITLTGVGAARRGQYDAGQDPTRTGSGMLVGGAVLLPASLIGMGMVRLFLWLPTPDCQTYDCVERTQNISTVAVGGLALTASIGAGLLMYGASYNRHKARFYQSVAVLPQAGRGYAGLGLTGRF
jgi:hypothetical protein